MRNVAVLAVLVFCLGGIVIAKTPPEQMAPAPAYNARSADYHPQVSPDIAALQAQERSALARGDADAARGLERQVQAILLEQQQVVPQSAPVVVVEPPRCGESFASDQRIHTGAVSALSADWEMDGTMWAAFAGAEDSTISVYRSADHGASWDTVVIFYLPPLHAVDKVELVVGEGDSGFVYVFENLPSNNGDLRVLRFTRNGVLTGNFAVHVGDDTVTHFTACRDFSGDNYWLYAVAHNAERPGVLPKSTLLRSADYGKTWAVTDTVFNRAQPRMAFGAGACCYLSCVPNQGYFMGYVASGVSTNWSSPGTWYFDDFLPDSFQIYDACIAPAFTTPAENATVWLAYTHHNGVDNWDALTAYATDTLLSWVGPTAVANTGHDEAYVDLKNYTSPGNQYVNLSDCDIDTANHGNAWLGYSSAGGPSTWTAMCDPWVNQSGYTDPGLARFPRIVYSPGCSGTGGGLVFAGEGGGGYFNSRWLAGVAESPAQPKRPAAGLSVSPSVAHGPVRVGWRGDATRLTVADVAGRIVASIAAPAGNSFVWDGNAPAGAYLVCLTTSSGTATRSVVIQ